MANNYAGYLLRFGSQILPNNLILEYSSTPNQRLESGAERDQNGNLQRDTLSNYKTSIKFSTHILNLEEKIKFQNIINSSFVNYVQRKCNVTYWNDETNSYCTGYFYIPDISFTISDASANDVRYDPVSIELIEY